MRQCVCALLFFTTSALGQNLSQPEILSAFESAGQEFGVPADVLKGIAFAETRWEHLEWAEGDTASCVGLPRSYGIMALRDDRFFGRSLPLGAAMIGETPATVRRDVVQNIRAASAYLQALYAQYPLPAGTAPGSVESWQTAIARYCGIPQPGLAAQHAYEILSRLAKGYNEYGIRIEPRTIDMQTVRTNAQAVYAEAGTNGGLQKRNGQPDYPPAHWAPAYPGHWYTTGYKRDFVVIHDMEGYYLGVISYFQQAGTNASVHYDVNGMQDSPSDAPAGDITQQVEEQYWAWHAVCLNRYSFGIEHEGFVSNPAWWSPEMYLASGKLVKYLCDKYSIPKDRNHIIGHNEYLNSTWMDWVASNGYPSDFGTCNSHTDPGINWDWGFLMQIVTDDATPPRVASQPPAGRVQVFESISVSFNQRLERVSAEQSFHISPAVAGTMSWKNTYRTLQFTPSLPLAFDTEYTVTVDTGAHNYFGAGLDVNGDGVGGEAYVFTFMTTAHDTVPPVLGATYPAAGQEGVSSTVLFEVEASEPMDPTTLAETFRLVDGVGNPVPLTAPSVQSAGPGIRIMFQPAVPLQALSAYTLSVLPSMKDYGGNGIASAPTIAFSTGPDQSFSGTVINSLDAVGSWWQPGTSGSTVGTLTTSFAIETAIKKSGTGSGKVTYEFAGPGDGTVREFNGSRPTVDPGPSVAAWVFGDNSRNALEYWFYPLTFVRCDTLNWTGWKLVEASIASVPTTAVRQFAGFVIKQLPGGRTSGAVYFDDLSVGLGVTAVNEAQENSPSGYALRQNFPNPFNPSTTIQFSIVDPQFTTLKVYDLLGREVAMLVNEKKSAGKYVVSFDASDFASGVYIYRIVSGGFVSSRSMVLLR
jgi:hypothetical protein